MMFKIFWVEVVSTFPVFARISGIPVGVEKEKCTNSSKVTVLIFFFAK